MIADEYDNDGELLVPRPERSVVAVAPPGVEPGYWAGAPSAVAWDGTIYLAYRLRQPQGMGRGYAVTVARSADGVNFEPLVTITKERMRAESLERPALIRTPEGIWRLYLSCATFGTKHWRIELIEAASPSGFDARDSRVALPGDAKTAVKDPVIAFQGGRWHLWASCHPLEDPGETDQMVTDHATSEDGWNWTWDGTALAGRPGQWDARGTRISAVRYAPGQIVAYYDGRATAAENFEERTGVATGAGPAALSQIDVVPVGSGP
ncbi:MAG: hypothetical protein LBV78_20985, partial [Kitasatospora sp.]|nr:hypothetical protein [Kitasatospora sp.]